MGGGCNPSTFYESLGRTVERLCPKPVRCSLLLDTKKPAGSIIGNQRAGRLEIDNSGSSLDGLDTDSDVILSVVCHGVPNLAIFC